ncbi:zinc-binding dehydrogenase [Zeaxanthinibacter sp. PT1]|uniref:zinc-binding dehydrogenase n=1 Tax=Zeaxanthinibacter TaxID=561554 RepID=UPI00234AC32D|nr:zinc-binding dehydrogenase [Zeaxanthinibacter sp. PT1]MDC6350091.1 zinc-binding dehydrogenase [Zeaxanthinibacter sp. PT1]
MKALVLNQETYSLSVKDVDLPLLSPTQVRIKIKAASINHHELWTLQEKNLKSNSDIILGSDGSGVIEKVGSSVKNLKTGDEVVINPSINWGADNKVHGQNYEILGFPSQGTFAEYICIDHTYVGLKPGHLSFEESAALPLAGLTGYRALFSRGQFESNNKVLITGIGGGVALFALKFAVASGADVYITSGDATKISKAIHLGAKGGVIYRDKNWSSELREMAGGFDVIVDGAAGRDFARLTELANPGGRIALFGRTAGQITDLNPKTIFWKQLSIHGTTMGNKDEFESMLKLVTTEKIKPVIDSVYPAKDINLAFKKMESADQFGKIIMNMKQF